MNLKGIALGLGLLVCTSLPSLLHAQPGDWQWSPTSSSGVMLGQATINGVPAEATDWIGAFDPAGNCAGAAPIIVNEGLAYFNLPIYGDDAETEELDEGITAGEPFTLRIWQATSNSFATYPNDDAPEYLDGWSNTNGAPISSYNDPSVVYDFALEVNLFIVCPEATCEGGPVQTLEWGPPGGLITGPGVTGVYWDPLMAGVGVHELTYTLGDSAVTCTVEVTETPDATIAPVEPVCANAGAFTLGAAAEGGVWSGNGVLGEFFDPAIAGVGTHDVNYAVGEGFSCSDSASISIVVYPAPGVPVIGYYNSGNELVAEGAGDGPFSWQWYLGDGTPLKEATAATFNDPLDGEEYYVTATNNYGCSATSESMVYIAPNVGDVDAIEWKAYWNTTTGCIESNRIIDACEVHSLDGRLLSSHRDGCLDAFSFLSGDSFHIVRLHSGRDVKTIKLVFGDLGH